MIQVGRESIVRFYIKRTVTGKIPQTLGGSLDGVQSSLFGIGSWEPKIRELTEWW